MSCESDRLRKEGNELYLSGIRDGLSPRLAKNRLTTALRYYYRAKTHAYGQQEVSSCLKNIGKVHYQLSRIKSEEMGAPHFQATHSEEDKRKIEDEVEYHAKESLKELFDALKYGTVYQSGAWCDRMLTDIGNVFSDLITYVNFENFDRRIAAMFVIAQCMEWAELKALLFVQIATVLHQHSVNAVEVQDFRSSLRAVHEMNYPLEEADRFTHIEDLKTDIRVLRADSSYQLASAESMQAIFVACQQLNSFLLDVEYLNMNMVFDTLDMFKDAALKAREINLEQEAIACYYQGHIFEKILKLKQKAKTFYMQVMQLTEAAKPKLFNGEKWYDDCSASLKAMQYEARERDERAQEAAKQKLRKEMETELNKIEEAKTAGAVELLKYLYSKHPPKNKPFKLDIKELSDWGNMETKSKKRLLLKVLSDFHPDKNPKADYGEKWHFLVGEISRAITHFHDCEKNLLKHTDATDNGTRAGDEHEDDKEEDGEGTDEYDDDEDDDSDDDGDVGSGADDDDDVDADEREYGAADYCGCGCCGDGSEDVSGDDDIGGEDVGDDSGDDDDDDDDDDDAAADDDEDDDGEDDDDGAKDDDDVAVGSGNGDDDVGSGYDSDEFFSYYHDVDYTDDTDDDS